MFRQLELTKENKRLLIKFAVSLLVTVLLTVMLCTLSAFAEQGRLIPARRRRSPRLRLSRARPGRLSTIREIISTPTLLTSIKTRVRR